VDEATVPSALQHIQPRVLLLHNISRDQLDCLCGGTFNNPPIDLIHPPMIRYKHMTVDSADSDSVVNHWDLTADQLDLPRTKTATGAAPVDRRAHPAEQVTGRHHHRDSRPRTWRRQ